MDEMSMLRAGGMAGVCSRCGFSLPTRSAERMPVCQGCQQQLGRGDETFLHWVALHVKGLVGGGIAAALVVGIWAAIASTGREYYVTGFLTGMVVGWGVTLLAQNDKKPGLRVIAVSWTFAALLATRYLLVSVYQGDESFDYALLDLQGWMPLAIESMGWIDWIVWGIGLLIAGALPRYNEKEEAANEGSGAAA